MGTFVLAFIGNGFVRSAQRSMLFPAPVSPGWRRRILVLLYFTAIVSCVTLFGISTIPDIIRHACALPSCAGVCPAAVGAERKREALHHPRYVDGAVCQAEPCGRAAACIRREAADFVSRLQSDSIWVVVLEKLRQGLGCAARTAQHLCLPEAVAFNGGTV